VPLAAAREVTVIEEEDLMEMVPKQEAPICMRLSWQMQSLIHRSDERLRPNLLSIRGKSIGGAINIDDEGSEHNFEPL
jgi:hypothetical protein